MRYRILYEVTAKAEAKAIDTIAAPSRPRALKAPAYEDKSMQLSVLRLKRSGMKLFVTTAMQLSV
eukprot:1673781-Pyramimonas_sp.AAC.1